MSSHGSSQFVQKVRWGFPWSLSYCIQGWPVDHFQHGSFHSLHNPSPISYQKIPSSSSIKIPMRVLQREKWSLISCPSSFKLSLVKSCAGFKINCFSVSVIWPNNNWMSAQSGLCCLIKNWKQWGYVNGITLVCFCHSFPCFQVKGGKLYFDYNGGSPLLPLLPTVEPELSFSDCSCRHWAVRRGPHLLLTLLILLFNSHWRFIMFWRFLIFSNFVHLVSYTAHRAISQSWSNPSLSCSFSRANIVGSWGGPSSHSCCHSGWFLRVKNIFAYSISSHLPSLLRELQQGVIIQSVINGPFLPAL